MKALTIRQPWAWLIVHAGKDIENRRWRTAYRGEFWVHAGLACKAKDYEEAERFYEWAVVPRLDPNSTVPKLPPIEDLQYGGIIGIAHLSDCVEEDPSPWFQGPYGFVLRHARSVPFRPIKGRLGWFDIDAGVAA